MSSFTITLDKIPAEYDLLLSASRNFKAGKADEALENFNQASAQLPVGLVQNIYYKVWILSNRPEGDSNFGEKAMRNCLISEIPPDNTVKANAIMEAFIEYTSDSIRYFMNDLNRAERCPISLHRMEKPVIVFSGETFDRRQIEEHHHYEMQQGQFRLTCPTTKTKGTSQLLPNRVLENVIETTVRYEQRLQAIPHIVYHLFQENLRYAQEVKRKDAEFEVLRTQTEKLIEQFSLVTQNYELQRQDIARYIHTLTEQHQAVQRENRDLREQYQGIQLENQGLRQQKESLIERVDVLLQQNQTLASGNQTLAEDVQSKSRQIQDLTRELQEERLNHTAVSQIQSMTIESLQRRIIELERRGTTSPATVSFLPTPEAILKSALDNSSVTSAFLETMNSTFRTLFVRG